MEIIKSAALALIPRAIRPDGKSIDETAMERTLAAGALDRFIMEGGTSAKPAAVADAYMINGTLSILLAFFLYGLVAGSMALVCETYFGGYTIGTVLIYNPCFALFWIGACTENMVVGIMYGCISVFMFYQLAKMFKLFEEKPNQ